MPEKLLKKRRFIIFYFLVAYMLLVFFWWWIMMFKKDNELYKDRVQLLYYRYQQEESSLFVSEYEDLMKERELRKWMIIGEGATFFILLTFGIYRLRSTIRKEVGVVDRQKNFLLSITHELKSPLASAKLNLQTLSKRTLTAEQQKLLIQNTEADVSRLNDLVEKILLASKMGHENMNIQIEEVNYSELVEDCISATQNRNPSVHFEVNVEENVWLNGDEILLKSLILNLIENAVKYAPASTPVQVLLKKEQDMSVLDICDEGEQIPDEEKEKIFDRFYRMGNEDTRTSTGVGLGLFIVQQVAHLHHGTVKIIDKKGRGKFFRVQIPYIGAI